MDTSSLTEKLYRAIDAVPALLREVEQGTKDDTEMVRLVGRTILGTNFGAASTAIELADELSPYATVSTQKEGESWSAWMECEDMPAVHSWGMKTECRAILACLIQSLRQT